ncbi:MAG: hypothetical protein A2268_13305 [Candidatus Raymondbacteria bacterium RifOxyA12_full_50_37]|uniref:Aminoglycoside phosphotransferase domain-containing protein n=1 Tax=Candidatus Raymondbacteria bacterium RIFOXYD12_FULL_49_13 TaxID=1817890 RepID=A0A1F7F059_UNCRA|nr:MAG: hypothetical protein A2268_13305 [Candidatus Raymondbacteria bacterium RifOxyA12_full_50_37]OGJ93039.1 MAG: hypothetical protein A2248_18440 [Candidatus Raymondbacteria bacterium RIFOXYA2_FULL_49_16]OGJ94872.1 MAG: hypothetical protein A2350_15495 [Candidatus Raymondbacteria bacterium RifOxyB12_full_50_8]OGJ99952.1 MAG: hypothetical protein A2519_00420 [Candidatus Raymondbacteria bacterium RIFOXYD12_FULL_49_13]OGK04143.1 MAG: hypothetical protein A2487_14100 [Candidatus Raymondbacteria 
MKKTIIVESDRIIKRVDSAMLKQEVLKSNAARQIGLSSGLFYVPKVLDINELQGHIVFERILGFKSMRELGYEKKLSALYGKIGQSLSRIHHELSLDDTNKLCLPEELALDHNNVFIHGDFSLDNVGVNSSTGEIVIIDWQMTKIHGGIATYGTRYYDIMWFVNNLFYFPIRQIYRYFSIYNRALDFISGYRSSEPNSFSYNTLAWYMRKAMIFKFLKRREECSFRTRMHYEPCQRLFLRFISKLRQSNI